MPLLKELQYFLTIEIKRYTKTVQLLCCPMWGKKQPHPFWHISLCNRWIETNMNVCMYIQLSFVKVILWLCYVLTVTSTNTHRDNQKCYRTYKYLYMPWYIFYFVQFIYLHFMMVGLLYCYKEKRQVTLALIQNVNILLKINNL